MKLRRIKIGEMRLGRLATALCLRLPVKIHNRFASSPNVNGHVVLQTLGAGDPLSRPFHRPQSRRVYAHERKTALDRLSTGNYCASSSTVAARSRRSGCSQVAAFQLYPAGATTQGWHAVLQRCLTELALEKRMSNEIQLKLDKDPSPALDPDRSTGGETYITINWAGNDKAGTPKPLTKSSARIQRTCWPKENRTSCSLVAGEPALES